MRVLLISQFFSPEPNSPRGLEFAKELSHKGHEVVAVTAYPNYPDGKLYDGYKQRLYREEMINGVRVIRLPIFIDHSKSVFRRFISYSSFALSLLLILPFKLKGKFDVLFAYCPPITVPLVSWLLSYIYRSKLVTDIQDFWPDTLSSAAGQDQRSLLFGIISKISYFTYRRADHISVISEGFKKKLLLRKFDKGDISVIYNWSTAKEISDASVNINQLRDHYGFTNKFAVLFAGNIGQAQALDHAMHAFKRLQQIDPSIYFYLYGSGVEKENLKILCHELAITNVIFRDRVSLKEINKIQLAADVMFLHLKKTPLFEVTIPSKLSGYFMVAKPIIGGLQGDAKQLLTDSQSGIVYEPENIQALVDAILKMRNTEKNVLDRMGSNAKRFYQDEIGKSVGVEKFESIFLKLTSE